MSCTNTTGPLGFLHTLQHTPEERRKAKSTKMAKWIVTEVSVKGYFIEESGRSFLRSQRFLTSWEQGKKPLMKRSGMDNNSEEERNGSWCSKTE